MKVPCTYCGQEVDRRLLFPVVTCGSCRSQKAREYARMLRAQNKVKPRKNTPQYFNKETKRYERTDS